MMKNQNYFTKSDSRLISGNTCYYHPTLLELPVSYRNLKYRIQDLIEINNRRMEKTA